MGNKKVRIRIINKTKEGCILDMKEQGLKKVPWKEFNESFNIEDKVWAVFNDKMKEIQKKVDDILGMASVFYMQANNPNAAPIMKAQGALGLASCQKRLEEECGIDMKGFIQLMQHRVKMINSLFPAADIKAPQKTDVIEEEVQIPKKKEFTQATNSLGDLCPELEKLKNKE